MADLERASAGSPQGDALVERADQLPLGLGESEGIGREWDLLGVLAVDDRGGGVGEQPFGEALLAGSLIPGGAQVRDAVQDQPVLHAGLAGKLERGLVVVAEAGDREGPPGLVVDADRLLNLPSPARARSARSIRLASRNATAQTIAIAIGRFTAATPSAISERSSEITGASKTSSPAVVGPSNIPRSGPWQSRCSASATSRSSAWISSRLALRRSASSAAGARSSSMTSGMQTSAPSRRRSACSSAADRPIASAWLSGRASIARAIASSSPSRSSRRPMRVSGFRRVPPPG